MSKQFNSIKNISTEIFRAYDIRGVVESQLTPDSVYTIARALADTITDTHNNKVVIARDGRLSAPLLHQALCAGLLDGACDVTDVGIVPTPVLYFATFHLQIPNGIMLTGSHNPSHYNGLKMVIAGKTLSEDHIQQLLQKVVSGNFRNGSGNYTEKNIEADYIKRIQQDLHFAKPLKIVIDCGNGVTGMIAPQLFRALDLEVIDLFTEVDGHFPNHHPDPTVPENLKILQETVLAEKADIGLAFDGDGDRVGVVTETGEIIWPDKQLMLLSIDLLSRHPNAVIVFDVKCSRDLPRVIAEHGGRPLLWRTGHSVIKNKMQEVGALLAGEMSGHIFYQERWYGFDDGLYVASRLLEIISQSSKTTSALFSALPKSVCTPELKLAIAENRKAAVMAALLDMPEFADAEKITIDGLRAEFADGWGLVRPSNTTAHLTLRFEANSELALQNIQNRFRAALAKLFETKDLPF